MRTAVPTSKVVVDIKAGGVALGKAMKMIWELGSRVVNNVEYLWRK